MRVLHVVDERDAAGGLEATLALIADTQQNEPGDHRTLLLGGGRVAEAAERVGLTYHRHWPSFRGLSRAALAVRRGPRALLAQAERVDAWSVHAAVFVVEAGCATLNARFGQVGDTPFARSACGTSRLAADRTEEVRERWGVEPGGRVVALLADRPEEVDLRKAALAVALAREAGRASASDAARLHLLIHPDTFRLRETQCVYEDAGLADLLIQDAAISCPWEVFPACDAGLVVDPKQAGLSWLWADLCGLSIIAPDPHDAACRPTGPFKPKLLAHMLTQSLRPVGSA